MKVVHMRTAPMKFVSSNVFRSSNVVSIAGANFAIASSPVSHLIRWC